MSALRSASAKLFGSPKRAEPSAAQIAIVEKAYLDILRRPADPAGVALHLGLRAGLNDEAFRQAVEASLNRSAEAGAFRYAGRQLSTPAEIEAFMREAQSLAEQSVDRFLAFLDGHYLNLPAAEADPHSREYREQQLANYRSLTGKAYVIDSERHHFDLERALAVPYPYDSSSGGVVGDQLVAWGHVMKAVDPRPGMRILEPGLGWGGLALQFAQMGCHVTGLDMEPNYLEVVRHRAAQIGVSIDTVQGDFFSIETMDARFDVVLFFEAFHHCDDHLRLLDAIPRILNPGGRLVLAGETIDPRLPYPWGVNCSGQAVWSISKHGWLELAFREEYLLETLRGRGWTVEKRPCTTTAAGIAYVCERPA